MRKLSLEGVSDGSQFGQQVALSGSGTFAAVGMPFNNTVDSAGTKTCIPQVVMYALTTSSTGTSSWSFRKSLGYPSGFHTSGFGSDALSLTKTWTELLAGAATSVTPTTSTLGGVGFLYEFANNAWGFPIAFYHSRVAADRAPRFGLTGDWRPGARRDIFRLG